MKPFDVLGVPALKDNTLIAVRGAPGTRLLVPEPDQVLTKPAMFLCLLRKSSLHNLAGWAEAI